MNVKAIVLRLKKKYPGKTIVKNLNRKGVVTEIICEIKPTQDHPEYSEAVAVVDSSIMHFHKKLHETYTIISGKLTVFTDVNNFILKKGDKITMKPGTVHANIGQGTWCHVYSEPGWTLGDHIPLENLMKEIVADSQSEIKVKINKLLQHETKRASI